MNSLTTLSFETAVRNFAASPNPTTLLHLNRAALPLLESTQEEPAWMPTEHPEAFAQDFYEIRVVCDRRLDDDEVQRLSGCLGYALRSTLVGEDLSEPTVIRLFDDRCTQAFTLLEYSYDSTKSRRDDPDFGLAFETAREMIFTGSPLRTTNRAGYGTKGTRLVEGIAACNLVFYVR